MLVLEIFTSTLPSSSCGHSIQEDDSLREEEAAKLSTAKRHSEGTFSNDYSKYLEDRKAQDFVRWLMNNKRSGSVPEKNKKTLLKNKARLVWCLMRIRIEGPIL